MTEKQRRAIEYLRQLPEHLYRLDYKDICIELNNYIPSFPVPIFEADKIYRPVESRPRDYSIIYRARENETFIPKEGTFKLPFKTVDEISIISDSKKEKIKFFGRCNKPFEPRFYASNNFMTACMEALTNGFTKSPTISKSVTVGLWKITEPLVLAQINYSEKSLKQFIEFDKERYEKMLDYTQGFNEHNLKQIKEHGLYDPDYIKQLYEILADEFAKSKINGDYDFKITNYYCDQIFDHTTLEDKITKVDGILYPSVSFSYQEMNLVLHPRAMRKLKFINAMMVWVTYSEKQEKTQFAPLEQQIKADDNGNLQWKKFAW